VSWLQALADVRSRGDASVLITVDKVKGSSPRGVGTRMLVSRHGAADTIGGGALELAALSHAERLLQRADPEPCIERGRFTLGKALSQCCGGQAILSFAYEPACDFRLEVFGAGNVALELARLARRLPCIATFHDPRAPWLARLDADLHAGRSGEPSPHVDPRAEATMSTAGPDIDLPAPAGVPTEGAGRLIARTLGANVFGAVEACRPGSLFVVMTHSHELDLEVCEAVLTRGDAAYLGLIASRSKALRFRSRLSRKGFSESELRGLTAPLGRRVRTGDTPMEVAIAAMADVLSARERARRSAVAAAASLAELSGTLPPADPATPDGPGSRPPPRQASSE